MSINISSEAYEQAGTTRLNLGRRKFLKELAALGGLAATAGILAACGDPTATPVPATTAVATTVAATTARPTTASATTSAATTAAATTSAPTTSAPTTSAATTAAPTTAARTTTAATTSAATTSAATTAASGGTAPAGFEMLGPVANFKADGDPAEFKVKDVKGFVYNKGGQYLIFSNICTHQGCEVPYDKASAKFVCPCHGSTYDKTGEVLNGPARTRLSQFEATVVGGAVYGKLSK